MLDNERRANVLTFFQMNRSRGFTLIEVLVAVFIVAILMAVAAPNFRDWVANMQIHTVAQSMQAGLQEARAEAIRLNTTVEFRVVPDAGTWEIVNLGAGEAVLDQSKDKAQTKNISIGILPAGATRVAFNFIGQPLAASPVDGSLPISSITVDSTVLPAPISRELNVTVNPASGSSRMCDPNIPQPSSRAC